MKRIIIQINYLVIAFALIQCTGTKKVLVDPAKDAAWEERCKGVTSLAWQEEIQGADAATTAKIVSEATVAAKADAKTANADGEIDASIKSELARVINENITASSKVDADFWKQENTFSRLYCLSVSLLDRDDISEEQKKDIVNDIREMQKAEANYMLGKKKKA